jgi:hypothetical protein
MTSILDVGKLRVLFPLSLIMGLVGTVGWGAWTLRGMHADIKGDLREQSIVNDTRWKSVDDKLSEITFRVQALLNDHTGFVTKAELRSYSRALEALNKDVQRAAGLAGIETPEVE